MIPLQVLLTDREQKISVAKKRIVRIQGICVQCNLREQYDYWGAQVDQSVNCVADQRMHACRLRKYPLLARLGELSKQF